MTEHENDYDDYRQREIKRLLADTIFYLQEASEHPESIAGIPTGFRDLDRMTGGLQRGDLIVIAGRPGMGKTALAMNIAEAVAIGAREAVALFSPAQPDRVLMLRLLSSLSGIAHDRLRKGDITDEGAREKLTLAVRQLVEAPLDINDDLNLTAVDLHAQTRRLQEKRGALGLILINDLQMIEQDNPGNNRMTTVDRIMRSLKLLAREMYAPVIVLSQVSQRAEQRANKRPLLADLPAAGAIEQHADVVLFIYRSEVYDPDSPERGIADINIAKQRNGPIGTVKLAFQAEYLRFGDLASGYDEAFDD